MSLDPIYKSDYDFELPDDRIAKYPLADRSASKLMVYKDGVTHRTQFREIVNELNDSTLLVMNNAKVIPARLYFQRATGATIEVLLLEPVLPASYEEAFNASHSNRWKCIIGNLKKWKNEEVIHFAEHPEMLSAVLVDREQRIVELQWTSQEPFTDLLDSIGELPLPPYLDRATEESDYTTYQTVFAKNAGSVAAPTAGLHFTDEILEQIRDRGIDTAEVTLHVGAGTFLPVKDENVLDHEMHREHFEISRGTLEQLADHEQVIAVGTTTLRVLESLYWIGLQLRSGAHDLLVEKLEPYTTAADLSYRESLNEIVRYMDAEGVDHLQAATEIMILPNYECRSIRGLITNFHLPKSTLLMLIASVVGKHWRSIYEEALKHNFRFLSYGDSSLLYKD